MVPLFSNSSQPSTATSSTDVLLQCIVLLHVHLRAQPLSDSSSLAQALPPFLKQHSSLTCTHAYRSVCTEAPALSQNYKRTPQTFQCSSDPASGPPRQFGHEKCWWRCLWGETSTSIELIPLETSCCMHKQ